MKSISSFFNTVKTDVRTSLKSNRRKSADSLWRNTNDLLPAEADDKAASTVEKREVPGKVGGALSIAGPQRFVWKQFPCHCRGRQRPYRVDDRGDGRLRDRHVRGRCAKFCVSHGKRAGASLNRRLSGKTNRFPIGPGPGPVAASRARCLPATRTPRNLCGASRRSKASRSIL